MINRLTEKDFVRVLTEIWQIVHTPTKGNDRADVHYAKDFDRIRSLLRPFVENASQAPVRH